MVIEGREAPAERMVWGVAALLLAAGDCLASRFGAVAVRGEVSGFTRAASGHCYFALKDAGGAAALLRCVMFRRAAALLDFEPRDGVQLELRGRLGLYEPRGELQMVVEAASRLGAGSLYEEFLRLRARLEAAGLFEASRKRPVPAMPQVVAVVTSPTGAALRDVLTTLARRSPQVAVRLVASPVQGADAPPALAAALALAGAMPEVDAVLLVRGGGSLEDLWAFNDERVVRAVAACARPVICGVGHETDVTLADLAADLRAATPTAAAELAAPAQADLLAALVVRRDTLRRAARRHLERHAQRLDAAALRLSPGAMTLATQHERLRTVAQRLRAAISTQVPWRAERLDVFRLGLARGLRQQLRTAALAVDARAGRLSALDPRLVLQRGFARIEDAQGRALTSAAAVRAGQPVRSVWSDGSAWATIDRVEP